MLKAFNMIELRIPAVPKISSQIIFHVIDKIAFGYPFYKVLKCDSIPTS